MKLFILFIFFWLLIISYSNKSNNNELNKEINLNIEPQQIINEIINRFDKMSETSINVAEKLKIITDVSSAFLKASIPFGALLFSSLDIVSKKDSKEYKSLQLLNKHMNYQFARMGERIDYSFIAEELDREQEKFKEIVTIRLSVLTDEFLIFTDPSVAKDNDSINDLLSKCSGDFGIKYLSKYIKTQVSEGCHLTNTLVYVKIEKLFKRLENEYKVKWTTNLLHLKKRILKHIYSMNSESALFLLEEAEKLIFGHVFNDFSTIENALKYINDLVKKKSKNPSNCLTDSVFNGNRYNRIQISYFQALIQIELSRLLIATSLCGRFMYTNETHLELFFNKIANEIQHTSNFLIEYIPKKLNLSTPVEKLLIGQVIEDFTPKDKIILPEQYNDLSNFIFEKINHVGLKGLEKQILIYTSENYDNTFNSLIYCEEEYYCYSVIDQRGVNIFISKFLKKNLFLAETLRNHYLTTEPKIKEILDLNYASSLGDILNKIKINNNITILGKDYAKSFAIVRNKTFFLKTCQFVSTVKMYKREVFELELIHSDIYVNNKVKSFFDDFTCFEIFFFL